MTVIYATLRSSSVTLLCPFRHTYFFFSEPFRRSVMLIPLYLPLRRFFPLIPLVPESDTKVLPNKFLDFRFSLRDVPFTFYVQSWFLYSLLLFLSFSYSLTQELPTSSEAR